MTWMIYSVGKRKLQRATMTLWDLTTVLKNTMTRMMMTKYQEALHEINKASETWKMFFIWQVANDLGVKAECPEVISHNELLNKILKIYDINLTL